MYIKSTSPTVSYLVAAAPTVTLPDPVNAIVIDGNPRPVTIGLANPTENGAPITDARLLMHRTTIAGPLLFANNDATTPLGVNNLDAITFNLGDAGSASGTAVARTGGAVVRPADPNPLPESLVDQTYAVHGVSGSVAVEGAPGDVVPVELSELVFSYRDPLWGYPLEARCTARDGLMRLGEVTIAGTTVTATPAVAREGTDEAWVRDLYQVLLGRAADDAGLAYWMAEIPRRGRDQVAHRFFQTPESTRARVTALYDQFLGRRPNAADRDFWATRVIARGDLILAVDLTLSAEYSSRAGQRFPLV